MRLWHYKLFPYMPDAQFKGQQRELVAIMRDWRDKGTTNHLLINKVTEYSKNHLYYYFVLYCKEYTKRYGKPCSPTLTAEFVEFCQADYKSADEPDLFAGWHTKEYLRVCMANLYEKHVFGVGASRIANYDWNKLLSGYYEITGEYYSI